MATDPSTRPANTSAPASVPHTRWYARSQAYRFLVEADYLWRSIGAAILGVVGVVALIVAVVTFNGVALALGLIFLPFALILWLSAKGVRDAGRES